MNRGFREEGTGVKQRQRPMQLGSLRTATMKEKEEELALFLEMRKIEKERNNLLLQNSDEFDAPLGPRNGSSQIYSISSTAPAAPRKTATDEFLNSDNDKNDYDWLITPPGTPLFPSLESESQRTVMRQLETSKARPFVLKFRLANPQTDPVAAKSTVSARQQPALSPGLTNSSSRLHRPSSSGGSRPASPTGRPKSTINSTSKPVINTTGSKPSVSVKPTRSVTPNSRSVLPSSKPSVVPRSSTPTMARSTSRSSTTTARASVPASKPTSRAATPTRRPTNPVVAPVRPPSSTTKNPAPPRSSSPAVKPRTVKPSDIPGFALDAPPNLRTSLPNRPISATRGRPGIPSVKATSVEPVSNGRVRRQSCSPSRGRPPTNANQNLHSNGSSVPAMNRLHAKANDNISPVLVGTKMVDRVMNMRKLAPPKQDDNKHHSPRSNLSGKSSSPESSGFGRTLSKKSLDMAMRHMDILRTVPGKLRPLMSNVPASSMYSVRSGPTRSRTVSVSVSDSPLATSSNASSDFSVNNNALCVDGGEIYEDFSSDNKDVRSPASLRGR